MSEEVHPTDDAVALVGRAPDPALLSGARLKLRLMLLVTCVVALLSLLLLFLVGQVFETLAPSLEKDLRWKVTGGLGELSHRADLGLLTGDQDQLRQFSARYVHDTDILYVGFHNAQGDAVFEHGSRVSLDTQQVPALRVHETAVAYAGWAPVLVEGLRVGEVQLVVSKQRLRAGSELYRSIVIAGLLGAGFALALAFLFVHRYIEPILRLTQRAFSELEHTTAAALASTRAKSRFLANMSHEIRTPMNGVLGMVHLVQQTNLDRSQRHYVDVIAGSAKSLLKIVNDILDFSKLEAHRYELRPEPSDLRSIVDQTVGLFRVKAKEKQLRLVSAVDATVPATLLLDGDRFRQVLSNLLSNALKFTSNGSVCVRVEAEADAGARTASDDALRLRVSVEDTGQGVPKAARGRLFRAFSQVDESSARVHEGTGLGLAICRRLVELMGGRIEYREASGGGSVFSFEIPVVPCSDAPAERAPLPITARFKRDLPVLVVDDNEINQLVAMEMVESFGLDVELVGGGREAVSAVLSGGYALVLMDCQMPDVDGYEATREIRRRMDGARRIPIVACTAHALEEERVKVLACGMDDYMTKPIEPAVLHRILARWLPVHSEPARAEPEGRAEGRAEGRTEGGAERRTEVRSPADTGVSGTTPAELGPRERARRELLDEPRELPVLAAAPSRSARVTQLFLQSLPAQLADLERAASSGKLSELQQLAHKIKGSAASVGALRMAEVCDRLQLCAESIDSARALACVRLIHQMHQLVRDELNAAGATNEVNP